MLLSALDWRPLTIYGDGGNVRDWLHVEDHASALLHILQEGQIGRSYNVGGESERTNLQIVTKLCLILDRLKPSERGSYSNLITFVKDRPGHDQRYAIDTSRLQNELSWRPTFTIDAGLEHTITWYLENEEWWRPLVMSSDFGARLGNYL